MKPAFWSPAKSPAKSLARSPAKNTGVTPEDAVVNAVYKISMNPQARAQDIVSAVMEIPELWEVNNKYELVVLAIQKAIESGNWTGPQLSAREEARTYFENMEY